MTMPRPRRDCQHCAKFIRFYPWHHRINVPPREYMGCRLKKREKCTGKCADFAPVVQEETGKEAKE